MLVRRKTDAKGQQTRLEEGHDFVVLALGHDGAGSGVGIQGVSDRDALRALLEERQEARRDALLQQQPGGGGTDLPHVEEDARLRSPETPPAQLSTTQTSSASAQPSQQHLRVSNDQR